MFHFLSTQSGKSWTALSFGKAKGDEHRSQEFVKRACRLKRAKPNGANQAKLLLALEDGVIHFIYF